MPITEIQLTVKEQTPKEGYLLKTSEGTYVKGAMLAPSQEPFEEVPIEDVPEELIPGYVAIEE